MKFTLLLGICTFILCNSLVAQTLPLKWEANLGTWPPDIFAEYVGKLDESNVGKIFVHYADHNGKYGYAIYNGATHAVERIDTTLTYPTFNPLPFGIRRVAPPFRPDFDSNGVTDIFVGPTNGGPGPWGFLDPLTGAYTVLQNSEQLVIIDVDDIDNDGVYELITEEYGVGTPYMLRVYTTGIHVTTSVQEFNTSPSKFKLGQNYPNPFNPSTRIEYELPTSGQVQFEIFDITGRAVRNVHGFHQEIGSHEFVWDGKDNNGVPVATGTYFYRLIVNGTNLAKKMLLLR